MHEVSLRARVIDRFGSVSSFARYAGWSNRKASYILNEKQEPTKEEMLTIAQSIGIESAKDFTDIFFPATATMWRNAIQ